MRKILLIIQREYLTRVKQRSFIVMTILGPLLMAATIVIPIYLASRTNEVKTVAVLDETGIFNQKFKDSDDIKFHYLISDINTAKSNFIKSGDHALLYIPKTEVTLPTNALLYAENNVNINVKNYIKNVMGRQIEELKLEARLRDLQTDKKEPIVVEDILRSIKTTVDISTLKIGKNGIESKSYTEISMVLGMFAGILIYFFIFMFGSQVMRGVIEEKTSRIVEVIISSIKPFQLMMGKIIGVGLVGLTQFLLWVVLTFGIVTVVTSTITSKSTQKSTTEQMIGNQKAIQPVLSEDLSKQDDTSNQGVNGVLEALNSVNFPVMIGAFLFFFIFGYLMYAALFAAIGGAVDSEADTQQFMFPITIPLILAIIMSQFIIQDPGGAVSFWFSIIPLTSPVVMMIRIPFGVPYLEIVLSMVLLILGFLGTTWLAAKIYRTGILMYGKKVNYKELWKWIKYKN
ncbi:MAG: ABC transporter permease [Bacteroidales bacterium]|nr:ABC transporter permease [Bacteroidales bacterium]MDD4603868.1 ABC transporter permease [Bacteroidales bacterium]